MNTVMWICLSSHVHAVILAIVDNGVPFGIELSIVPVDNTWWFTIWMHIIGGDRCCGLSRSRERQLLCDRPHIFFNFNGSARHSLEHMSWRQRRRIATITDTAQGPVVGLWLLGPCFRGGNERADVAHEWSEGFEIQSKQPKLRPELRGNDRNPNGPDERILTTPSGSGKGLDEYEQ
ncbi:hypothetical protein GGU10DRAFT_437847 [Lentinula aff. detonsa]|uniref:Secreted protein n=1 Tax=Lentinula aff. detonsa TaxID=2804958 RepID=A0AA38KKP4_9AGAR|nr:hypothetical protein GGU10DRAFT_437847 [Lentinula aff. detonsa]